MKAVSKYKKPEDMSWREIKELSARTDRKLADLSTEIQAYIAENRGVTDRINHRIGNLRNSYGKVMELVVIPGARSVLSQLGHNYDIMIPNLIEYDLYTEEKEYEVDLFLVNGTEAMALEVKGRLVDKGVTDHIKQLEKLRADEKRLKIKGKALYGCLASISIDKSAKKRALDAGIYVLEIIEDQKRMNAFAPEPGKVGRW